jgi:hypothetical protein
MKINAVMNFSLIVLALRAVYLNSTKELSRNSTVTIDTRNETKTKEELKQGDHQVLEKNFDFSFINALVKQSSALDKNINSDSYKTEQCQNLPRFGSPIILFSHFRDIIQNHMSSTNLHSSALYIYFSKTTSSNPFSTLYTMVWELNTPYSKAYSGVVINVLTSGVENARVVKFIYSESQEIIFKVLKIKISDISKLPYQCGDQKYIFNLMAQDSTSKLNLIRNPELRKSLEELKQSTEKEVLFKRDCDNSRFINSSNFYFKLPTPNLAPIVTLPIQSDDPNEYQNYFELSRCDPDGQSIVQSITLYCSLACCPSPHASIVGLEASFGVPFSPGKTEKSPLVGNAPLSSKKIHISLSGVYRIDAIYPDDGSYYALQTYDKENRLVETNICGKNSAAVDVMSQKVRDSVLMSNFLGLFGGWKSYAVVENPAFAYFGFVKYV